MFKILEEIRAAKGKEKMKIMEAHPELKQLFKYAYDPFLKYNLPKKKIEDFLDSISEGNQKLRNIDFHLLGRIAEKEVEKPSEFILDMLELLTQKDADILRRIVNKDLEIGVSRKTVEKVWPGLLSWTEDKKPKIPIMLCHPFDKKKLKFPCLVSIKLDGVRARYAYKKLYTRQGKIIKGMEHILNMMESFDGELDGEITVPGKKFDQASGLIRSGSPTPSAIYNVFDAPGYPGGKGYRTKLLSRNIKKNLLLECSPVKIVGQHLCYFYDSLLNIYERAINDGEEGVIICSSDGRYQDKRSWDWMKLVPKLSVDLPCVGFEEGTGKNKGRLGAIIVGHKGILVNVGTGFPDNERKGIWENQELYLGKTAEIEYKEESKKGALRMPRFKCWRWDK